MPLGGSLRVAPSRTTGPVWTWSVDHQSWDHDCLGPRHEVQGHGQSWPEIFAVDGLCQTGRLTHAAHGMSAHCSSWFVERQLGGQTSHGCGGEVLRGGGLLTREGRREGRQRR